MVTILVTIVLLVLLGGICCYLARRLYQGLSCFFPGVRFWQTAVVIGMVTLLLALGFIQSLIPLSKEAKHILGLIGGYCMGIALYLLLFTVAADLLLLIPRWLKLPFTKHSLFNGFVTLGVLLLTVLTCIGGFTNAQKIHHVSYDVRLDGKADISDIRIVMISDLHLGAIGSEDRLETIVDEINALEPDVVCIAGDFFDTDFMSIQDPDAALGTLRKLRPTYGTYACLGNHDGGQTHKQMVAFLEEANIHLLSEAYTLIDNRLVLVGRLDGSPIGGYGEQARQEQCPVVEGEDPQLPVIVMDHNPANIAQYTHEADLILCGHTHQGQVFPGNLITNLMYAVDYGYYQKNEDSPHVIVTSGVGTWGMPMRVGTNSEIVTIRFH